MNLGKEVPFEEYILVLKFKMSRQKFYPGRPYRRLKSNYFMSSSGVAKVLK